MLKIFYVFHLALKGGYDLVAKVEAVALGQTFELTNHIHDSWTLNKAVVPYVNRPRSTDVGDVVLDDEGTVFAVAPCGWERIGAHSELLPIAQAAIPLVAPMHVAFFVSSDRPVADAADLGGDEYPVD